jgi:hypothetical protein
VVTKQKDKSVHDQALEKSKEKYPDNTPKFVPQPKPVPKNYPNPARASFKLINDDSTEVYDEDNNVEDTDESQYIDASNFHKIKPKFKIQSFGSNSESFESILTQGHASNYKSTDPNELKNLREQGFNIDNNPNSILEEFKREAGSLRDQQE